MLIQAEEGCSRADLKVVEHESDDNGAIVQIYAVICVKVKDAVEPGSCATVQ